MGHPMGVRTACSLWFVVVLAVATGSGGDVISPTPDFAPVIELASPPNSGNLQNTVPAPPLSNMAPEPEGIPPVIPIVSHTAPPAFSPDQLPSEHSHSTNVSPPARAPSTPVGPADVSPSSSISAPPPLPQLENGPANATQPNISPSASSPVPLASLPPTIVPPQLPISLPNISASPPFFHTAAPRNAPPPTNVPPPLPNSLLNISAPPPTFHSAVPTNGPVSSPKQSSPTVTRGQIKVAPAFSPSEVPTHLLPSHRSRGVVPVSSPWSPDAIDPPNVAPPIGAIQPQKGKTAQPPVLAPTGLSYRSSAGGAQSLSHPPMHLKHPWSTRGPIISPFPSDQGLPPTTFTNKHRRHAHPPISAPTPSFHPRSSSPVIPKVVRAPSPSSAIPSKRNPRQIHAPAPALSPSGFTSSNEPGVPSAPAPTRQPPSVSSHAPPPKSRPAWVFPPPPPNLDCSPLTCMEPLTYSPPGSPCACVRPMKVGLRLTVELYSFFPLVSELAQEIASSTSMKQSQVRIMGANAGSEQPDKTIVLVDLVPLGERFDSSSAFLMYQKFWEKQVVLNTKYFGLYDVLYVSYPGLPPSPPMSPSNINVDDGPFGRGNHSRPEHPLGVDVGRRKEKMGGSTIAIIVLSSAIAFVLCAGAVWIFLLKRNDQSCLPLRSRDTLPPFTKVPGTGAVIYGSCRSSTSGSISSMATYSAKTFSAVEIEKATNKCDDANIIGEGGFGRVYQGTLEDGTQVAVKVLKRDDQQGGREFLSEVEMLSRLHHRNLVKLIGICTEEHLRCLVYELIPNGSVESHLHGPDMVTSPLDWGARMKIALGSARGLAYLHEDSSPRVIHRDFKSSNILLEHDFTAKVSDFGLARTALEEGKEHISTRVMGTFGYVAPEYAMTGHLLVKSDVYSYGVVLLELLSGRKPVDMLRPLGQENLVTWARPLLSTKEGLETLIDPTLGPDVPFDSVSKVAAIASMCIQSEVSHRPFMGEVVQALKLVCNGGEEHQASDSCSREDSCTHDPEIKAHTELAPDTGRMLPASEIFSMPMGLTRNTSLSFRRQSSSGPLETTKRSNFWRRVRGLTRRSTSEHSPQKLEIEPDAAGRWP